MNRQQQQQRMRIRQLYPWPFLSYTLQYLLGIAIVGIPIGIGFIAIHNFFMLGANTFLCFLGLLLYVGDFLSAILFIRRRVLRQTGLCMIALLTFLPIILLMYGLEVIQSLMHMHF